MLLCKLVQALVFCSGLKSSSMYLRGTPCISFGQHPLLWSAPAAFCQQRGKEGMLEGEEGSKARAWEDHSLLCTVYKFVTIQLPSTSAWSVMINDHRQRKMPCQSGVKTPLGDKNKHTRHQLCYYKGHCACLLTQWRMELMGVNTIHPLATLPTATFPQGKGTLD